jgi:FkbH-like protein
MKFLDASRILSGFAGGPEMDIHLTVSWNHEPLHTFIRAAAAEKGWAAQITGHDFGALVQQILSTEPKQDRETAILAPWDFTAALDWRTGIPKFPVSLDACLQSAEDAFDIFSRRNFVSTFFLNAPVPPIFSDPNMGQELSAHILTKAASLGAITLPNDFFSLAPYLASGCPIPGNRSGYLSTIIVDRLVSLRTEPKKLLVTDLDNTLWHGVVAEDGHENLLWQPEGAGYPHYIYQTLLQRMAQEGVAVAAVSKNDIRDVETALRSGMPLERDLIVAVRASYGAKSAEISKLVERLNLGLGSVVFVDDNPVEIAEVQNALPQVECITFPDRNSEFAAFFEKLGFLFRRETITEDDRFRPARYKKMLENLSVSDVAAVELDDFLLTMEMRLTVFDRSRGDWARALQLLNKTNQFNLNGRRWSEEEIVNIVRNGGTIFSGALSDNSGQHGEVVVCVIDAHNVIQGLVMSCRVFQRKIESAFLGEILRRMPELVSMNYARTDRNQPFSNFMNDTGLCPDENNIVHLDAEIMRNHVEAARKIVEIAPIETENGGANGRT